MSRSSFSTITNIGRLSHKRHSLIYCNEIDCFFVNKQRNTIYQFIEKNEVHEQSHCRREFIQVCLSVGLLYTLFGFQ